MPITSWPAATARAAATALSTPPLMATTTRLRPLMELRRRFSARLRHQRRQQLEHAVDVGRGGGRPYAEAHPVARRVAVASHREQHVRGLGRPGGARRAE